MSVCGCIGHALYPKLDTAFALFEKWGLTGMMVDFMDRDDQEMVNMQTEILQKAAATSFAYSISWRI